MNDKLQMALADKIWQEHKLGDDLIPEMQWAKDKIKCDADIRSMCSAGFAEAFCWNNR